jgi:hypothetical protein
MPLRLMSLRKLKVVSKPVTTMKVFTAREAFSNGIANQRLVYWNRDKIITVFNLNWIVEVGIRMCRCSATFCKWEICATPVNLLT